LAEQGYVTSMVTDESALETAMEVIQMSYEHFAGEPKAQPLEKA